MQKNRNSNIGLIEVVTLVQISDPKFQISELQGTETHICEESFQLQITEYLTNQWLSHDKKPEGSWILASVLLFGNVIRDTNSFYSSILSVWLFNHMLIISWMQMAAKAADTESIHLSSRKEEVLNRRMKQFQKPCP